jgi:peptide/nickel transport system permease protein
MNFLIYFEGVNVRRYFGRKLLVYLLTFFVAVTIDWLIPRLMPGDPISILMTRFGSLGPEAAPVLREYYTQAFNLDLPAWQQYLYFWNALLHGNLGTSVWNFPNPVAKIIGQAVPFDIFILVPSILLSYFAGNWFGAFAARSKWLDNTISPLGYILTATPYMWLAIMLLWSLAIVAGIFPPADAYPISMVPNWSWNFIWSLLKHWFLPFLSLFLVGFGGWAIGMRNMIIYELEADYSHYLEALGAPRRLVRKYAFGNAMLPQLSGLALSLGTVVAGALATEIVFNYPGIGFLILQAVNNKDYFLLQGCFLFIITGVLLANFIIDIVYVLVDPRTRIGMQGETA